MLPESMAALYQRCAARVDPAFLEGLASLEALLSDQDAYAARARELIAVLGLLDEQVDEAEDHPDAMEIFNRSSAIDASVSLTTVGRDVFFFSNCERDDTITYTLLGHEKTANGAELLISTLSNKRNGKLMALIVVKKTGR